MDRAEDFFEAARVSVDTDERDAVADLAGAEPSLDTEADRDANAPFDQRVSCQIPRQEYDKWCWAAVAIGIANFHANSVEWQQCALVNQQFGQTDCCSDGDSEACNKSSSLGKALLRTGNLEAAIEGPMDLGAVKQEISRRRPMGARIDWGTTTGHVATIVGCRHTANDVELFVSDPWYGDGLTISWRQFNSSYQGTGTWSHAYRTKVKG